MTDVSITRSALALLAASVTLLDSSGARAAEPASRASLDISSDCPSRAAVERELWPLLGSDAVSLQSSLRIGIDDLGASYRIRVGETQRLVEDALRNCGERAKVSAVFIALNLPPSRPRPAAAPLATSPVVEPLPVAPRWRALLRVVGAVEHAPEPAKLATNLTLSGELRRRGFGVALSVGAQAPVEMPATGDDAASYDLLRLPSSLTLGYHTGDGEWAVGLEGGLALDLLRFRGLSLPNPDAATRLNAGLRSSLVLRLRASRNLAAVLVPTLAYYPRTYLVRLEPTRLLGESPRFWWGVGIGLESSALGG